MPRDFGEGGGQIALIDAAEPGEMAGAVDQQLIPDAASVPVDHEITREIEALGDQVGNDILGIVGDASALVVIGDGNNVAMERAAVDRARLLKACFEFRHCSPLFWFVVAVSNFVKSQILRLASMPARSSRSSS